MKFIQASSVQKWLTSLSEATRAFKLLQIEDVPRHRVNRVPDFKVTLNHAKTNKRVVILIEAKSRLTPREAIAACSELSQTVGSSEGVLIACPYVSPRVAEICRRYNVGYLDQAGNCNIRTHSLSLHVEGRPNPAPVTRPLQNPFASKASRLIRLMLTEPSRQWHVGELAKASHISIGLSSKAKNALIEQGYVEENERKIRVREPGELLNAWAAVYKPVFQRRHLYVMNELPQAEISVARWCEDHNIQYALAEFSGAWRLAPMVRYNKGSVYIKETTNLGSFDEFLNALRAKPVETGSNLSISLTSDESVFFDSRKVNDLCVASPIQLFLDLHANKGRGQEAADELFRQYLEPSFKSATQRPAMKKANANGSRLSRK